VFDEDEHAANAPTIVAPINNCPVACICHSLLNFRGRVQRKGARECPLSQRPSVQGIGVQQGDERPVACCRFNRSSRYGSRPTFPSLDDDFSWHLRPSAGSTGIGGRGSSGGRRRGPSQNPLVPRKRHWTAIPVCRMASVRPTSGSACYRAPRREAAS
jgi:hypothetical protein